MESDIIPKKLTIKDIARLSGFSKSTVSRVLKNDPNVKASTRAKIKEIMGKHNFIRSELAASMVTGSLKMVLIIAGDIANPFYGRSVKKIEEVLDQAGYATIVCSSNYNSEKEIRYLNLAAECHVSGVILMTAIESQALYDVLDKLQCPVILMNRYLKNREFDTVVQDNYKSSYRATRYLIECGHRNIAILASSIGSAAEERVNGFLKAMADAKCKVRPDMVVYGDLSSECGAALAMRLAQTQSDITALLVSNDAMTMGFVQKWHSIGKKIPEDISVICYDHTPVMDYLPVSISSVGVDGAFIGDKAADVLLSRIKGYTGPKQRIVLEAELSIRKSVKIIS
ncbi:MAG: LacI family DNA-binding transcriptional regulator [Bacillota bacterium]